MNDTLEAFLRRLQLAAVAEPEPLERLDATGLDSFEESHGEIEVGGAVDPKTGAIVRWLNFPAQFARPERYPTDWPFIPGAPVGFSELEAGGERGYTVVWPEPDDVDALWQAVWQELTEQGWRHLPDSSGGKAPQGQFDRVAWFCRAGWWRILTCGTVPGSQSFSFVGITQRRVESADGDSAL